MKNFQKKMKINLEAIPMMKDYDKYYSFDKFSDFEDELKCDSYLDSESEDEF